MAGSIAGDDGRLKKDDKILAVNGKPLSGMTQGQALGMLKNFPAKVSLTIHRKRSQEAIRSYTLSAIDLRPPQLQHRPPSPQLIATLTPPTQGHHLPATKSFSHFIDRRTKSRRGALENASKSFDLTVGGGVRNSMYGDTDS